MLTEAILSQIRSHGWIVKTFRVNDTVEMHAIKLDESAEPQIARCNDGDDPDCEYRCACPLAEAVGIRLDG